jgi:uncharacterized membrane protein
VADDGRDREQRLEERIARLEARLRRLEGVAGIEPESRIQPGPASVAAGHASAVGPDVREVAASEPPSPTVPPAPPRVSAWIPPASATPAGAAGQAEPMPGWAPPNPRFRLPSSLRLPDLSGSLTEIEARLTGQTLAWVGGLALVLGASFFLSLAFSRGWIGPELRVLIGLVAGSVALAGGAAFMERGDRLLGHVLTPVGLAVISISLVGATRLYGLVPVEVGLAVALLSAVVAATIAVRSNSQAVAAFGLVAVLLAPPLMGATPDMATLAFIAVVLVGTTSVALWRSWSWLPPTAFLLSAPQTAAWVTGHPEPAVGLLGIGLFWVLNLVAAGGEAFRRQRDDLSPSSATLLLANVAFAIWAGFVLLSGDLAVYRGFFLVLLALVQIGVGGSFVVRYGDRNLFGLLSIGTGIAALTMAAPIQLGASAVPVAWSAEAVALAWLAVRRGHPYSALVSGILFVLAGGAVASLYGGTILSTTGVPFVDGPGASLAFFIAAVGAGVWLTRDRTLRGVLAAFGLVVVAVCVPTVLDAASTTIALSVLMVAGAAAWRVLPALPEARIEWQVDGLIPRAARHIGDGRAAADLALPIVTAVLGLSATWCLVGPVFGSAADRVGTVPFVDPAGAALAVYLAAVAVAAWLSGRSQLREPLAGLGLLVTAWACAAEFDGVALVGAWSVLMVVGFGTWRALAAVPHEPAWPVARALDRTWTSDLVLPVAAVLSGSLAALHTIVVELPIGRFGDVLPPAIPFTDDGAVAAMILVVSVIVCGAVVGGALSRRVSILLAGAIVAYAIPFEVYAWAVAVLWVGLGGLALVMARLDRAGRTAFLIADAGLVGAAALVTIGIVSRPTRLVVGVSAIEPMIALQSVAAGAAVALGLAVLASSGRFERWARWAWLAAGVSTVYLLSVAVVDVVANQVGGPVSTAEIRTQGQVAISVLWAFLGVVAFVAGLRLRIDDLRRGGLALLGLATAKVFLFDLSALDVAYRVISLIALGLLLLASAWVWQRLQPRPPNGAAAGPSTDERSAPAAVDDLADPTLGDQAGTSS